MFFPLVSLKVGLTYDVGGVVSGRDAAPAKRKQTLGLQVVDQSLRPAPCLPKRTVATAAEFADYFPHDETLIFDGIEQGRPRPRENEAQKDPYAGKKLPPPQSGDAEHCEASPAGPQSVLGRQDARLSQGPGRISSSAAVGGTLSPPGGPGVFRYGES